LSFYVIVPQGSKLHLGMSPEHTILQLLVVCFFLWGCIHQMLSLIL
jgi:hypothetical protein